MKRFLSTTAVLAVMTGAAYADAHSMGFGTETAEKGDFFASDLIGMRIYNSETEFDADTRVADGAEAEWDDIGEINDVLLSQSGEVKAVILGVGGFLGIGERDVSVSMDNIKVVYEEGETNDRFLVVNTSKEVLETAPAFDRDMSAMDENMQTAGEQIANNAEATTERTAENAEATTEQLANDAEATTEQLADNAEATTEQLADNAEGTTEQIAAAPTLDREPLTRPQVEREGYQEADMAAFEKLTADEIEGSYVYGANDETVGEIDSLIMSEDGKVAEVVINVGGFLGLGEKPVAVTFEELQILQNAEGGDFRIYIDSTEEKLESLPEYQN